VHVDGTFYLFESTITVSNSSFTSNIGSLLATETVINFTNFNSFESGTIAQVNRINFEEGGALTTFQSTVHFEGTTTFDNNQADNGGAIHATESILNITGTTLVSQNSATRNGGGVYLSQSEIFCQPSSSFSLENNSASKQGGGMYAMASSIEVSIITNETLVNVVGNIASRGGGLAFSSNAKLYVLKRNFFFAPVYAVEITDNSANYGGALHVDDASASSCESTECFLQVLAIHRAERETLNTVAVYIANNSATSRRSASSAALFGGLLDRCTVSPLAEVHNRPPNDNIANYVYNESALDYFLDLTEINPDTITSGPVKVCFCFNGSHNCSHIDPEIRMVKKGESFMVSLTAVDQIG
jgi:predicted outer membrane repeat protein